MASKKLPEYVHCAKCGYRGVDAKHDCTTVRAATAAIVDQAAKRGTVIATEFADLKQHDGGVQVFTYAKISTSSDYGPPMDPPTRTLQLAFDHSRMLGRHITYAVVKEPSRHGPEEADVGPTLLEIQQRCRACCSDINKRVAIILSATLGGIELAAAARKSYLQHRCPEARANLQGFTYAEIEELHAELDRELNRIGAYLADVDAIRKQQERATTSRKDEPR